MPARRLTAREIAELVDGELIGRPDVAIAGAASLEEAGPGDLAFLASGAYLPYFRRSSAGVVLVAPQYQDATAGPATRIVVSDPRAALGTVLRALFPAPTPAWGIAPTASVGRGCRWVGRIALGPHAVLGPGVRLGADCRIGADAQIGEGAVLGDACRIDEHVVIAPGTELGHRVVAKAGARIGTEGFGYTAVGPERERLRHVGRCQLGDDVEIGANSTVDRGSVGATRIGPGTKIDNLVQVGHNVRIGARCVIMAQVGIAGTTTIGDDVILAGQAGLAGQLRVGDGARIAAQSGVIGDIAGGATVSGYPARDHRSVLRQSAALARLTPLVTSLERLLQSHERSD
jgi:UDP-3-O-[3-hydroxymyristoyl] glucosamine N-acyltransferase